MQSRAHRWKELFKLHIPIWSRRLLLHSLPSSECPQHRYFCTMSKVCSRRGLPWHGEMESGETEHTIRENLPCSTIIVGREVSSCLLSSPHSTVKIAIFDDSELLQELHRTTVPERAILTRIMKTLERIHFAHVLPGNNNLERINLSISLGIGFLLEAAAEIIALIRHFHFSRKTPSFVG